MSVYVCMYIRRSTGLALDVCVLGGFQKLAIHRTCIQCTGTSTWISWSRTGWSQNTWIVAFTAHSQKKKKFPNEGLVFSIIIFFSVGNSYSKIDPSDQVKQEKKKKKRGKETRQVCSYKNAGLAPNPPCHANIIQLCVVRKTKQVKNRETSRKEKKN